MLRLFLFFICIGASSSRPAFDAMDDIIHKAFDLLDAHSRSLPSSSFASLPLPTPESVIHAPTSDYTTPVYSTSTSTYTTPVYSTPSLIVITPTPITTPSMTTSPPMKTSVLSTSLVQTVPTSTTSSATRFLIAAATHRPRPVRVSDPLVLDMNHDGNVTASLNTGISMNPLNWFDRTGGATGGDKMLAMCDLNKNGVIDGTEVFGDLTKFPLWGQDERTYNGFIALRKVARALEAKYSNLSIVRWYNGSHYVMLDQLQTALRRMDCDLGFISDDNRNPKKLEPLGQALGIDISNWTVNATEKIDLTGIAHYQQGWYIDQEGHRWKANDVWFRRG